ncbi:hypothetical protein CEXT_680041, partial [Caerostris extrusa]
NITIELRNTARGATSIGVRLGGRKRRLPGASTCFSICMVENLKIQQIQTLTGKLGAPLSQMSAAACQCQSRSGWNYPGQ